MKSSDTRILILDATAFYAGIPFFASSSPAAVATGTARRRIRCYTTSEIFEEVKHIKRTHQALEALIDAGNLVILEPEPKYVREAKELASESGDTVHMSKADLSVIALALHFRAAGEEALIVTDDNAVENVARMGGIEVSPVMGRGIRKVGRWLRYCSACGISYGGGEEVCRVCGNRLRMKLIKKSSLTSQQRRRRKRSAKEGGAA